jgi:ribose-phosphate pyrophosphokinase
MIRTHGFTYERITFPVGEMHVRVQAPARAVSITLEFEKNEEVLELLMLVDALRRLDVVRIDLAMPYVPFGRQDRVAVVGEAFSLKVFCDLVNGCKFDKVYITDPHSDVTTALLNNVHVTPQWEVFEACAVFYREPVTLVCPDGGALKKAHKLAEVLTAYGTPVVVVECSKQRNVRTGEITGVIVHNENPWSVNEAHCVIVDDICDGGRTFVEIAKELRRQGAKRITLMVTHGFFTKGLGVFDGLIDEVFTRNGRETK